MKVFVSYTLDDLPFTEVICRNINNAFRGRIEATYSTKFIRAGALWKDEIKRQLNACDALICILSSRSNNRPWIYVEWSAFWVNDKKVYFLVDDDLETADIFDPLKDYQYAKIGDREAIGSLLESLAIESGAKETPFEYCDLIVRELASARRNILRDSFKRFEEPDQELPFEDREKYKIAIALAEGGSHPAVRRVCSQMRDISYCTNVCLHYLAKGHVNEASEILVFITRPNKIEEVGRYLIDNQLTENRLVDDIIERLSQTDQSVLTRLFYHAIQDHRVDSSFLLKLLSPIDNLTEIRKIVCYLAENKKDENESLMISLANKFIGNNYAELRKTVKRLQELDRQNENYFREMKFVLQRDAPREYEKLVSARIDKDNNAPTSPSSTR